MSLEQVSQNVSEPWYLAQLKPGGFERAVTNLARQGYESFMPMREETRRRAERWDTKLRPLFPGYLFVKVPDDRQQWRSINATYGVSRLVALDAGRPTQVAPELIAALQARVLEDGKLKPTAEFDVGDKVRVVSGPLADKLAEIESVPEQGRIYVLLELMGRYTKAVLSTTDVERS
ncbi:transcriptional activator RfaH [Roseovarius sp. A21]|uniref:Transcriptional activator RfaH n=1 Tax=Roseovarius bejariae TaxID=2576383 RepID=A0A844CX16_9RHOB|nr:transcriptional activator RfaH [Roseovarius bejariae]